MQDTLNKTFSALADPTRRAMIMTLSKGDATVNDLARPFLRQMSLPAITKHIKVLENAGLITKTKEAQYRPCKINTAQLQNATDWLEQYREMWEESLDRLDAYLKTIVPKTKSKKGRKKKNVQK